MRFSTGWNMTDHKCDWVYISAGISLPIFTLSTLFQYASIVLIQRCCSSWSDCFYSGSQNHYTIWLSLRFLQLYWRSTSNPIFPTQHVLVQETWLGTLTYQPVCNHQCVGRRRVEWLRYHWCKQSTLKCLTFDFIFRLIIVCIDVYWTTSLQHRRQQLERISMYRFE